MPVTWQRVQDLKTFTEKMKWSDWKVTLLNFLKSQPGRNGVPLSYNLAVQNTYANFLDKYAAKASLQGRAFDHNASKVHSYIIHFISENNVAEQKVLPIKDDNNGRLDFIALRDFYEGVGANSRATLSTEAVCSMQGRSRHTCGGMSLRSDLPMLLQWLIRSPTGKSTRTG